jgi:hypothetical protein
MKNSLLRTVSLLLLLFVIRLPAAGSAAAARNLAPAWAPVDDALFIHHSVGSGWLYEGGLETALTGKSYIDEYNDITYGVDLAPDPGRPDSLAATPGDLTDMGHWLFWFNDYLHSVLQHEAGSGQNRILLFKSCYPNSWMPEADTGNPDPFYPASLESRQAIFRHPDGPQGFYTLAGQVYLPLEQVFAEHADTLFVIVTPPPLSYYDGMFDYTPHNAAAVGRVRSFNDWLKNTWLPAYNAAHPGYHNVVVFDIFNLLAYPASQPTTANYLQTGYGGSAAAHDSHPNSSASLMLTDVFALQSGNILDGAWSAFSERARPLYLPLVR